ncbi:BnaC09g42520D [Brassica napus]|uniref:BnaC09g42520D protein n=1 Tax=Brassica napus TaxID=3708 RepID=A0A078GM61_BRANA|nr:BnaC09g42520D [Brassica napus]
MFTYATSETLRILLIRGNKTMHLRVKQQNSTALRMAHVLEAHPKVSQTTIKFIDSLKIPYIATSFGGCESFVDQPAARNWDVPRDERLKYGLKDNLVRFSFGVEDFDDLKADILQALDTIPTKTSLYSHQNGVVSDKN